MPWRCLHGKGIPVAVFDGERDDALRARLHAAAVGAEIDDDMVDVPGDYLSEEPPELPGKHRRSAVGDTDDVTGLDRDAVDRVGIGHGGAVLLSGRRK